jgi:hypothetical protein
VTYYDQKIDHDSPYVVKFDHPNEGTVATLVPFGAAYTDRWGNKIDDRKPGDVHVVSLHISGPSPYDNGFILAGNVTVKDTIATLDPNGRVNLTVLLTSTAGPNSIQMDTFGSLSDKYRWIQATTTAEAVTITEFIDPPGADGPLFSPIPYVKANSVDSFTIKYTLYDRFNNPAGNQWVWVNTSATGDQHRYQSNGLGQVWITYGPRATKSTINVTATVESNSTLAISQNLDFYNTAPVNMEITANPETMPSNDVDPTLRAEIKAKIMDEKGNPVAGQTVTFITGAEQYDGIYTTTSPMLESTSAVSNGDGFAIVRFKPGAFTQNSWDPHYSTTASGNCSVTATWGASSKSITVTWKNYPYLSVSTAVEPVTAALHDVVTVTIKLKGDGYKLRPYPVDAILLMDRSGSMGDAMGSHSKLYWAKVAANTFVDNMSTQSQNHIGIVPYTSDAILSYPLSNNYAGVKKTINDITATDYTGTRKALKLGIDETRANRSADPKSVQAIILMTDGEFNYYGDPLARGTGYSGSYGWTSTYTDRHTYFSGLPTPSGTAGTSGGDVGSNQDMSLYAKNYNIRIYTIFFSDIATPSGTTWDTMGTLATVTGGKRYHATSGSQLTSIYNDIAGELKKDAGVDTSMNVNFNNVNVTGIKMPGKQVFSYVYDPAGTIGSTNARSSGRTMFFGDNETTIVLPILDQRDIYDNTTTLYFSSADIGTIVLNETYTITFKLKVNQTGSIDIFSSDGSRITFNGGEATLGIPHTFLTVSSTLVNTGSSKKTIQLTPIDTGSANTFIPLEWTTYYDGRFKVGEEVAYRIDNSGPWLVFTEIHGISPGTSTQNAQLDMRKLPPGGYSFRVKAFVDGNDKDAGEAYAYSAGSVDYGGQGRSFIKLE